MAHKDPTREEILSFLKEGICKLDSEISEFDIEEAIYWFANDWHSGQFSNLYGVLSTSEYKPGVISNGCEKDSMSEYIYEELESEYA